MQYGDTVMFSRCLLPISRWAAASWTSCRQLTNIEQILQMHLVFYYIKVANNKHI